MFLSYGGISSTQDASLKSVLLSFMHVRDQCKIITDDGNGHLLMVGSKFHGLWRLHIVATKPQSAANIVETSSQPAATRVL